MESIGNPGTFLAAAREVALRKPIFVLKTGRSAVRLFCYLLSYDKVAAKAALSHTGSLAGSDDVLDAALHRAGVIRINSTTELQDVSFCSILGCCFFLCCCCFFFLLLVSSK